MESPKSDKSQTRFSTPVSDLDDHRGQSWMRPRGEAMTSPQTPHSPLERRTSNHDASHMTRTDLLQVNEGLGLREGASVSRDFETAILDDDKSATGENVIDPRGSVSPAVHRHSTTRRHHKHPNRSRDSSTSSRSSDTANSVDAFADPRRRERANTIGSRPPSELDVGLQRTVSGGTHRRRPTFNNGSVRDFKIQSEHASYKDPADDICFPAPDESSKRYRIDFEELDEFVAEHKSKASANPRLRQKLSFSSQGHKPLVFNDLRRQNIPQITTECASLEKLADLCTPIDSNDVLDEKHALPESHDDPLGANGPPEHQHVPEEQRFSFFNSELEQTIHAADLADLLTPGDTFRDLFELPEDSGVWWLDVMNPTEEELHVFQRAFGIHRLTTEDIITQEVREKVELFKQYYFVCFRSFLQTDPQHEDYMEPVNVYMVVFREGILTFTYTHSPHAANVRKRIGKLRDYMALTADWICYAMMYVTSACLFSTLR